MPRTRAILSVMLALSMGGPSAYADDKPFFRLTVTGYSVAAVDTPVGYLPLHGPDQYGYRDPTLVFLQNLHLTNSETQFVPGEYRYSFNVFPSYGIYLVSTLITIRMD